MAEAGDLDALDIARQAIVRRAGGMHQAVAEQRAQPRASRRACGVRGLAQGRVDQAQWHRQRALQTTRQAIPQHARRGRTQAVPQVLHALAARLGDAAERARHVDRHQHGAGGLAQLRQPCSLVR